MGNLFDLLEQEISLTPDTLKQPIGEGSSATVWIAEHKIAKQKMSIKAIDPR
jgi:hypothetical protein